jgi:Putative zinc-finger
MRRMDCAQLVDAAPELALGILPGDERAAALAHLDECPGCQQHVSSLAGVTDQLLLLTPKAEPAAGFEQRVLASLTSSQPRPVRHLRMKRRAAVAVLALAACLALAVVLRWAGPSSPSSLASAEMRTESGAVVGQVFVHRESPAVLFMSLPSWAERVRAYSQPGETYALRIERSDGPPRTLPVTMNADAAWATTLDVDPRAITTVAMIDSQGHVWCRAQFGTAA